MAMIQITHQWADGSATQVRIRVDASFPDAVAEAKANAVAAMRDMLADFTEVEET